MAKQVSRGKNWYVIHTYSGYEEAVARNLKQRIESFGMEDKIFNVIVPTEKKIKIKSLQKRMGVEEPKYKIEFAVGDPVKITDGPFKEFDGKVSEIDEERGRVKVLVSMFGRETPVELDFLQVKKI